MGQGLVPYGLPLSWPLLHLADCERRPSIGRYARLSSNPVISLEPISKLASKVSVSHKAPEASLDPF